MCIVVVIVAVFLQVRFIPETQSHIDNACYYWFRVVTEQIHFLILRVFFFALVCICMCYFVVLAVFYYCSFFFSLLNWINSWISSSCLVYCEEMGKIRLQQKYEFMSTKNQSRKTKTLDKHCFVISFVYAILQQYLQSNSASSL